MSGLTMKLDKACIYFGGVSHAHKSQILDFLYVVEGSLPLKQEYLLLLKHITDRVTAWCSKLLSFAGKLELIKSVICSICNYWSAIFVFPKCVLREIESICKKFLWSSRLDGAQKYPVAWDTVCRPKQSGGLGLRSLLHANMTLMLKLFWNVANKKDVLWIWWIHARYIKENNVWTMEMKSIFLGVSSLF